MNQQNQDCSESSPADAPMKRKRGRPRKDENTAQQERTPATPIADNMIGQLVSGVVEGSFDAGYLVNVKVEGTEKQMKGVAFIPGKFIPVTAENDVAPGVKMYEREEIAIPSLNMEPTQPQEPMDINKEMDTGSEPQMGGLVTEKSLNEDQMDIDKKTDTGSEAQMGGLEKSQFASGFEPQSSRSAADKKPSATDEALLPHGSQIKDGSSAEKFHLQLQISDSMAKSQALQLTPQSGNADPSGQQSTVQVSEASGATGRANNPDSTVPKDSVADATTSFVDFFTVPKTSQQQATPCSSNLNLEFFEKETKTTGSEQQCQPLQYTEHLGFNLMAKTETSPTENVPAELRLELGNKTISGSNTTLPDRDDSLSKNNITEMNHPQPCSSRSSILANLFEGEANTAEQETVAAVGTQKGYSSASTAGDSDKNVDCNNEEAVPPTQSQSPMTLN